MHQAENEVETSPVESPEDSYLLTENSKSDGEISQKISTRRKGPVVCDWKDCNMVFRRPSDLT